VSAKDAAAVIFALRRAGMSRKEIAAKAGVSYTSVARLERGEGRTFHATLESLRRIRPANKGTPTGNDQEPVGVG